MTPADETTAAQKALVCLTSFCCASAAFFAGAIVLVPVVATLMQSLEAPEAAVQTAAVLCLFGSPVVAALAGLHLGVRLVVEPARVPRGE